MGIAIQSPEQYENSLRNLFPRGSYWDRQFADSKSDCSLFCRAKLEAFIRFRTRMSNLQDESILATAAETLDEWERIISGTVTNGLDTDERRALLIYEQAPTLSLKLIKKAGTAYGIEITDIIFPFRPSFFGFSRFALDQIAGPVAFSVLSAYCTVSPDMEIWKNFKTHLSKKVLSNFILLYKNSGEDL
jgi:hypothetical protein